MNTNNAHLLNQTSVRILSPVNYFVDTPFWYDALDMNFWLETQIGRDHLTDLGTDEVNREIAFDIEMNRLNIRIP
jgi:hypothetical protein